MAIMTILPEGETAQEDNSNNCDQGIKAREIIISAEAELLSKTFSTRPSMTLVRSSLREARQVCRKAALFFLLSIMT